ncbi:hypothetical protein RA280_27200 [Cupriavidus sp. CV2]|nr:hypothetical protein [Cupriavidus sp. CV2]MDW3685360.1 hypothetical protein [Cupriavidus sp. CV2]
MIHGNLQEAAFAPGRSIPAWRVLEIVIGITMWVIAAKLLFS